MKKGLFVCGFFCLILFVITKYDSAVNSVAKRNYTYGNLYDFSKIKHFRFVMPPKNLDSSWIVTNHDDADIILIGDSFSETSFGHPVLPQLIGKRFNKKVFLLLYKDLYLELPDLSKANMEGKTVIYESTERFLVERFTNPRFYNTSAPLKEELIQIVKKVYGNMFVNAERNYNYFIDHNVLLNKWGINEVWATLRFDLSYITPPTTPRFSIDPPMLFYHESVNFFYNQIDSLKMLNTVKGLKSLFNNIKRKGANPILLTIPEKYTIYHDLAGEKMDNTFLANLHSSLRNNGVNYVSIYDTLLKSDEIYYWPADTHLNVEGYQLILNELSKVL
ncbi:SGNH/GDSL hydrolase family protein [Ekhidna sp.]|uniref:SGNH/GDSL hydrolase family protein n=1 Tax=Ekhidna sp. TaxID=2608089 RepID=UPI003299B381